MPDYIIYIVGVPIIIALLVSVVLRVRALNQRIRKHLEDEAAGVVDPYEQMLALARVEEALQQQKKMQKQARSLVRGAKPDEPTGEKPPRE